MNGPSCLPEVPGRGKFSTWPASNEFFINHTHDILERGGDRAAAAGSELATGGKLPG